jgi:hypothetical protein
MHQIPSTDRKHEHRVVRVETTSLEPLMNTDSQPSSFTRAVNSETLSVGPYASIPAILRKSFTAWEACPAPPPDPQNEEPPVPIAEPDQLAKNAV